MSARNLTCASGLHHRYACHHHHDWFWQIRHKNQAEKNSDLTGDQVKQACCVATCFSLLSNNTFTCPTGYESPNEESDRSEIETYKSSNDLQKKCCRVSCLSLFKAKKFSCPSNFLKPTLAYKSDAIGDDINVEKPLELQGRCCGQKSLCYSKLIAKGLNCHGFGTMPGLSTLRFSIARSEPCESPDLTLFLLHKILYNQNIRVYGAHRHRRIKL